MVCPGAYTSLWKNECDVNRRSTIPPYSASLLLELPSRLWEPCNSRLIILNIIILNFTNIDRKIEISNI